MFVSLSGKIPLYEPALLSKPANGIIRREGSPEVEFTTAGTWFVLETVKHVRSYAPFRSFMEDL
jgi:hypothetical protein